MTDRIAQLEKRIKKLEETASFGSKKKSTTKRKPSAYNLFVKDALSKIKKENPGIEHKDAWTMAAEMWREKSN